MPHASRGISWDAAPDLLALARGAARAGERRGREAAVVHLEERLGRAADERHLGAAATRAVLSSVLAALAS